MLLGGKLSWKRPLCGWLAWSDDINYVQCLVISLFVCFGPKISFGWLNHVSQGQRASKIWHVNFRYVSLCIFAGFLVCWLCASMEWHRLGRIWGNASVSWYCSLVLNHLTRLRYWKQFMVNFINVYAFFFLKLLLDWCTWTWMLCVVGSQVVLHKQTWVVHSANLVFLEIVCNLIPDEACCFMTEFFSCYFVRVAYMGLQSMAEWESLMLSQWVHILPAGTFT
jgi:hypothetical protein